MKVHHEIESVRAAAVRAGNDGATGLVPTMGGLHAGHLSLMRHSEAITGTTFATIFLNPTQFAAGEDLDRYPQPIDDDLDRCREAGVAHVFVPKVSVMYPPGCSASVVPPSVANQLEGEHRAGHFAGVCTVVLKLFQVVPTTHAFFGKKDYQQWRVLEAMVRDFNVNVEVVGCEIVRDFDGIALSTRNGYLDDDQRGRALSLSAGLNDARMAFRGGLHNAGDLENVLAKRLDVDRVDYVSVRDARTLERIETVESDAVVLVAAHVGTTRLIDNVELLV